MTRKVERLLIACACLALIAWAAPATADVYDYDFNGLTQGWDNSNTLHGQDNWAETTSENHKVYPHVDPRGGAPNPGDGLCITEMGGTGNHKLSRQNDSNWSYDLSDTATLAQNFALQWSLSTDYQVSGYYGHGKYGIQGLNGLSQDKSIFFGIQIEVWYYGLQIWDALGTRTTGTQPRPTGMNQVWDLRLVVDTDASSGEGTASLYSMQYGTHTEWQAVGGLQDVVLYLDTTGFDILAAADKLRYEVDTRITAADNFQVITPKRGDANLDYIVDGQDFTIMKSNFGQTGKAWADGDWNNDGLVDGQDFTWLKANFGNNQQYTVSRTTSPVPEPATILLLAGGACAALLRRRKR